MGRSVTAFSPEVADQILRYRWPGNVRELQNAMERAVVLAKGTRVELEDLPEEARTAFPELSAVAGSIVSLQEMEKRYIIAALALNGGNQARTAVQLNIGSATLYRKLKKYGKTSPAAPKAPESGFDL
ncbi:MAG: helix-turn-helix domain-containing protein [Polyangiaceae bacterium]